MFENQKCCVGLKKDGGWVIPHDPDGWTESVQCEEPVVAMEKYADYENTALPVCEKHRPLIHMIYKDLWRPKPDASGSQPNELRAMRLFD